MCLTINRQSHVVVPTPIRESWSVFVFEYDSYDGDFGIWAVRFVSVGSNLGFRSSSPPPQRFHVMAVLHLLRVTDLPCRFRETIFCRYVMFVEHYPFFTYL